MTSEVGHTEVYIRKGVVVMTGVRITTSPDEPGRFGIQADSDLPYARLRLTDPDHVLGSSARAMVIASPVQTQRLWHTVQSKAPGFEWEGPTWIEPQGEDKLGQLFGLKSRRGLFAGTRLVSVSLSRSIMKFDPSWRSGVRFESFRLDYPPKGPIILPFDRSDEELGAALREAHARSSG